MTRQTEERLRAAFEAKADQVTAERLERLAAQRQQSLLDGTDGWQDREPSLSLFDGAVAGPDEPTRHARWLAPALAAAAVAAIAVAVTAVATSDHGKPAPHPPATQVTSPSPSSSPSASPSPSTPASTPVAGPPYLPAGQTGNRDEVPWSAVGAGWRLVLPSSGTDAAAASLYLYDPAGGRYLINARLPAGTALRAWSPDGTRAMLDSYDSSKRTPVFLEVDLRSGAMTTPFPGSGAFITYTQPRGLAVLVYENPNGTLRLFRYGLGGHLEHDYATDLPGHGKFVALNGALYLPDGADFVSALALGPLVLVSNDGRLVRTYGIPKGYDFCTELKLWTETSVLERCTRSATGFDALYLQPVSGEAPTPLTTAQGRYQMGYDNAWPISNGHTLLENTVGCGTGGYDILLEDGTTRPLRVPAGIPATNTPIINVDGDRVTFQKKDLQGCGGGDGSGPHYRLIDYNLVTGATSTLLDGTATIASWPGTP